MRMAISGVCGRMGGTCARIFAEAGETLVFFVDPREGAAPEAVPRFASPADVPAALTCDCMVDFSSPAALGGLLAFAAARHCPTVLATTGYTTADLAAIGAAARSAVV